MKNLKMRWVGLGMALLLGGCKPQGPGGSGNDSQAAGPRQPLGVVDLDKVAGDLGWGRELETDLSGLQTTLRDQLQNTGKTYDAEMQERIRQFAVQSGQHLTPEQQRTAQAMYEAARQTLANLQNRANQDLEQYRLASLRQYRDALSPVIREVATDHKIDVVIDKNVGVLFAESAVDLTDAVVDAARAKPPTLSPIPKPSLPQPGPLSEMIATQPSAAAAAGVIAPPATQPVK